MRKSGWYINIMPLFLRKSNNCKTVLFHHRLNFQCFGQINKQLTPIYTFIFTYIYLFYVQIHISRNTKRQCSIKIHVFTL